MSEKVPATLETEADLIEHLRKGDLNAFSCLYEKFHRNVHNFILSRTRDRCEAEDLTQETFFQALRSIDGFEGRSSILTWLFGIAHFVCLRAYRNSTRWMTVPHSVPFDHDPAFDARTEARVDALQRLDRCIEILEIRQKLPDREIFYLRYFEHLTVPDIAREVGKSRDSIKTSLWRSRKALRTQFELIEEAA